MPKTRSISLRMRVAWNFAALAEIKHIGTPSRHLCVGDIGRRARTSHGPQGNRERKAAPAAAILWAPRQSKSAGAALTLCRNTKEARKKKPCGGTEREREKRPVRAEYKKTRRQNSWTSEAGGKGFGSFVLARAPLGAGFWMRAAALCLFWAARYWDGPDGGISRAPALMIRVLTWKMRGALEFCVSARGMAKRSRIGTWTKLYWSWSVEGILFLLWRSNFTIWV